MSTETNGNANNIVAKSKDLSTDGEENVGFIVNGGEQRVTTRKGSYSVVLRRLGNGYVSRGAILGDGGYYRLPEETDEEFGLRREKLENIISKRRASRVSEVRDAKEVSRNKLDSDIERLLKHLGKLGH